MSHTRVAAKPVHANQSGLKVNLLSETGRRLLTTEPVTDADLADFRCEAWLDCFLRRGLASVPLAETKFHVIPIFKSDSDSACAGFALEADAPRGSVARREYGVRALTDVARRGAERLLNFGVLQPGDRYHLELVVDRDRRQTVAADALDESAHVTVKSATLHFLSVPLRPLLKAGRAVEELDPEAFHVFYTEAALAAAERYSRKGSQSAPIIETGAALSGFLCLASDATDLFVVVTDVLEAVHSEGTEFSLTYTSESWTRISRIMTARQSAQPACRLCGSAHGHNFSPGDPCAACFASNTPCGLHNIVPSSSDHLWTRSVFAHQPWALCHIFGANARRETLSGLFTFRWGTLTRRGLVVLPEFDPGQWETICASNLNLK
jgi:hypothetical protein